MLKTIIISLFLFIPMTFSYAFAATKTFSNIEQLSNWITFYYSNPEPQHVAKAIHTASSKGLIKNGQKAPPFIGFIAGVMNKNPTITPHLANELASLPEIDQPMVILGIWYSTSPEAKAILEQLKTSMPQHNEMIDRLLTNDRLSLLEIPLEQGPWVLDALWGYFMATGDEAPVTRIISALPWVNVRGDVSRLVVGNAAKWSLESNAIQHERVLTICRKEESSQSGQIKEVLREIVTSAEKEISDGKTL